MRSTLSVLAFRGLFLFGILGLVSSCASTANTVAFSEGESLAVLNFSFDSYIGYEGEQEETLPPLIVLPGQEKKPEADKLNKEIMLDSSWMDFREKIAQIFAPLTLKPAEGLSANASYQEKAQALVKTEPGKKLLSKNLSPTNMFYLPPEDRETFKKVSAGLGADYYLYVENFADFVMTSGLLVGDLGEGQGKLSLQSTLSLFDKGGKLLWKKTFVERSAETAALKGKTMDSANFPKLVLDAQTAVLRELNTFLNPEKK